MKRVLVLEPDVEVRALYQRAIRRLGHEPVVSRDDAVVSLGGIHAVIVEPGAPAELAIARTARAQAPELPIVCASIYPANGFGLGPVAFLEKPFRLAALEHALQLALVARDGLASAAVSL